MKHRYIAAIIGLVAMAMPSVAQTHSMPEIFTPAGAVQISGLSDNGVYAVSVQAGNQEVDNPQGTGGWIVDLTTNTSTQITSPSGWASVSDVSDDGLVVGEEAGKPAYWTKATGKWTHLPVPPTYGGGCLMAVTPDGRYAVGYLRFDDDIFKVAPACYDLEAGKMVELTGLPTVDLAGEDKHQNVLYGISPDGRYALGQMSQSYMMPVSMFSYIYDLQAHTWKAIGYDYDDATQTFTKKHPDLHFISGQHLSCDGAWVAGTAYIVQGASELEGGVEFHAPYRYNVATDQLEIYTDAADRDVAGNKVTADGTLLACAPVGNPYPTAMVRTGNYFVTLDQILSQVYGTSLNRHINESVTGAFECVSADGLTAVMVTYDNCYVIRMHEPFAQAAASVDLLSNYSVSIPDGSKVSQIGEIKITFDRAISALNQAQNVKLLDGQGQVVRSASGFTVSAANDHQLVVTFRTTSLTPGEAYTVEIPQGMVWLKNDYDVQSQGITLHYTGREEGPVNLLNASPASGSVISEFNPSTELLLLTFDTPVLLSDNASCALYNDETGDKIADFMGIYDANQVAFYPLATYPLYKGSKYHVVVTAGSVTDLSGLGPSQEITLEYTGAYVREIVTDDVYVYRNDCSDYSGFIMHKNEVHQPGAIPESWGFTADNMWMLLRDNEESDDWAMAAHSMFDEPGQSDDWLVTPQLFIPEEEVTLVFDAQSYLSMKSDVLKVYAYVDDAIHNHFSQELTTAVREQGHLLLDERLSAGATDEGLIDEWTHYSIDLSEFAGKNIYIAFVNYNYNQSAVFIDNVAVKRNMSFVVTNETPQVVVASTGVTVSGLVSAIEPDDTYEGVTVTLLSADGQVIDEISEPQAVIAQGADFRFEFAKPLAIEPGYATAYSIHVTAGADKATFDYTVKDLLFEPQKRVVLEEYTGSTCGNCPLGILAIENLEHRYPDNFIPITLRTYGNDPYAAGMLYYTDYLGLAAAGAPSGRINRGDILHPMLQNGSEGYVFYGAGIVQSDGTEAYLWADAVADELKVPAEAAVTVTPVYDPLTNTIDVTSTVTFALNVTDRNIGLMSVVLEDHLQAVQLNYFSTVSDPSLGEWGLGGAYGSSTVIGWEANDVARMVVNGNNYGGTILSQSDFAAGEGVDVNFTAIVPADRFDDISHCKVVTMVIDGATRRVINANVGKLKIAGGIGDVATDGEQAPAMYYNLQGQPVANPVAGLPYIKVAGGKAQKVIF